MSLSEKTKQILQEVAILGTGNAVNEVIITELEGYVGSNDDYSQLRKLVNTYMANRAAAEDGTYQLLKIAAFDALGLTLSDSEAIDIAAKLGNGEMTWDFIFEQVITNSGDLSKILSNRGEAAQSFLSDLASAGKSDYFDGIAVDSAVKNNLQSIGSSALSLSNGKSAFAALADRLKVNGIESYVADGYVKNATVFVDTNGDSVLNAGEWSGTTDGAGNYLLPSNTAGGKIIAFGGTDIMTGKPFQGMLTAPVGSTVVNPLTTLAQQLIEDGKATTVESALGMVQKALDLPENTVILHYDPLADLANVNASDADKSVALKVQAIALQVSNVISQIGSAIEAGSSVDKLSGADAVISALAAIVARGGKVNLSSGDTLTEIVKTASGNAEKIIKIAEDLAKITAASNGAAANAMNIVELSKVATVAQDSVVTAIVSGVFSGNLGSAVSNFTGSNLNSEINQAIPQYLKPDVPIIVTPPPDNNGSGGGSASDVTPPKLELAMNSKMTFGQLERYENFLLELGELAINIKKNTDYPKNDDKVEAFTGEVKNKIKDQVKEEIKEGYVNNFPIIKFFDDFFGVNPTTAVKDIPAEFMVEFKEITKLFNNPEQFRTDIKNQFSTHPSVVKPENSINLLRLYFSEPIVAGKNTIRIVNELDEVVKSISINDNNIPDDNFVYFIHDHNSAPTNVVIVALYNSDDYSKDHIEFDGGVVTDVAGNNIFAVDSIPLNVFGS